MGDTSVLFPQPLLMARRTWAQLSAQAVQAAQELSALEQAVADDPSLQKLIGVPRALQKILTPGPATGDEVHLGAELSAPAWEKLLKAARYNPAGWIAQRRFDTDTLASTRGH